LEKLGREATQDWKCRIPHNSSNAVSLQCGRGNIGKIAVVFGDIGKVVVLSRLIRIGLIVVIEDHNFGKFSVDEKAVLSVHDFNKEWRTCLQHRRSELKSWHHSVVDVVRYRAFFPIPSRVAG
jgi:hypothetical protein